MSLSVSNLVRVTVSLSPQAAAVRSFGTLLVGGDSDVINGAERLRSFSTFEEVTADFGIDAPESKAAELYFSQVPKPPTLMIGRWFRTASSGENIGGILNASEQVLSNWTSISAGSFTVSVDGTSHNVTGLNFTGALNLNGVATVINTAISAYASCVWNGQYFEIISNSTGAGAKASGTITLTGNPSYGAQAFGTITLSGQPTAGDTVTIKGTVVTFVSGTPSGNQVQISAVDDTHTAANLQAFLQASVDANLVYFTYNTIGLVTTLTAVAYGTAANSFTLARSGSNIAVSGATFSGGVAPDSIYINGYTFTFVAAGSSNQSAASSVIVGPTDTQTAANLLTKLSASVDSNVIEATYSRNGLVITVTFVTAGTSGNSFVMTKSSSTVSLSGGNLTGGAVPSSVGYLTAEGAGTDVSAQLKMTASLSQALIAGYDAESPVEAAAIFADISAAWYGLMFQASVQPTDDQNIAVSAFIEALDLTRIFGVTITDTNVLSALVSNDLASRMKEAGYLQSFCQYSSMNVAAVASFFGRAFSVDFSANNTTITLMFKQEPGVIGEDLPQGQADVLKNKRCNVFVDYVNDTVLIQYGTMSGPAWFDEIHGVDWLQNDMQTSAFNVLYTSLTKIPQTDAGVNQIVNALDAVCSQAVANGLAAPGTWNGPAFGEIVTGQFLKQGYYIYAQPVALQSQSDRDARKCPPITVAIKLAGAIQSVDILVDVNQ